MVGLGKQQLHAKFELSSFSRGTNIKGKSQNFAELSFPKGTPTFSYGCDFMMGLAVSQAVYQI